jgi:hypothetical protein
LDDVMKKNVPVKSPYQKPQLVEYGQVAKLTMASGSANGDAGQGMMA